MLLIESALNLIFLNSKLVDPYKTYIDAAIEEYSNSLAFCVNASEIKDVIFLGSDYFLPVTLAVDTYESYLSLNRADTEILRLYASFIIKFIPEWDDYAKKLLDEAKEIEDR